MTRLIKASVFFTFVASCGVAFLISTPIRRPSASSCPHELFVVVEKQLAALRAADYSSAYHHAASSLQRKFSVPQFEAMIRRDYGDMLIAQHIEFGSVTISGSKAAVEVFFSGESGSSRSFVFHLVAEGASWKINEVFPQQHGPSGNRSAGLRT